MRESPSSLWQERFKVVGRHRRGRNGDQIGLQPRRAALPLSTLGQRTSIDIVSNHFKTHLFKPYCPFSA